MRKFLKQLFASKLKITMSSLGILVLIAFSGIMIFQMTKVEVAFAEDGEEQTVQTHAKTVSELLDELDITPSKHDDLSHQMNDQLTNGMNISYTTGKDITLTIDQENQHYITTAETVGEFLQSEDIQLSKHDDARFESSDEIKDGMHLELEKGFQITVNDGGKKKKVWANAAQTYGQLLADNHITFKQKSDDKVNKKLQDKVKKGKNLTITRIAYSFKEEKVTKPFETIKKYDDTMEKGVQKVTQEGKDGMNKVKYRILKKNNKHEKQEAVATETLQPMQNRIVVLGTKAKEPIVAEVSNKKSPAAGENKQTTQKTSQHAQKQPASAKRTLTMVASAYTANCGGCSGYTATGINLNSNPNAKVVAVDPGVIALGTKIWVEGYGVAIAGDTGGAIKGNRIDLHVASDSQAHAFGTRSVTVKILD